MFGRNRAGREWVPSAAGRNFRAPNAVYLMSMYLRPALLGWMALAALAPMCLGTSAQAGTSASEARVRLSEKCSFEPLAGDGLALRSQIRLWNVGPVPAKVTVRGGWTIERLYPKAKSARTLRLDVGRTTTLTVKRTIPSAPLLRAALDAAGDFDCASQLVVSDV